eukprot:gene6192-6357_t
MDTKAEPAPRAGRRRAGPAGFEMSDGDDGSDGRNHRRRDLDEAITQYSDNWWRTTRGRMKWFDVKKGFGFVATEAGGDRDRPTAETTQTSTHVPPQHHATQAHKPNAPPPPQKQAASCGAAALGGKDAFVHKSAIVYDAANACPGRKCSLYLDGELDKLRASHLVWLGDDDPVDVPDAAW